MRFLIDAQLSPALCGWLEARGHEANHVVMLSLGFAEDRLIADRAEALEAVLVSKDADFLLLRRPDRFALLWLRCGNLTRGGFLPWLEARWPQVELLLSAGERLIELR